MCGLRDFVVEVLGPRVAGLERAVLRKCVSGKSGASGRFGDFHTDGFRVGRAFLRGTKNRKLAENFAVNRSNKVVLPVHVTAPDLAKLYGFHRHVDYLPC